MLKLTEEQAQAVRREKQPAAAVDPETGQVYRLIRQEVYDVVCASLKSQAWGRDDDGDEDLIRKQP